MANNMNAEHGSMNKSERERYHYTKIITRKQLQETGLPSVLLYKSK